jgi:putative transposase
VEFLTLTWFWSHRKEHPYQMRELYHLLGITKQAFHQRRRRVLGQRALEEQLLLLMADVRRDHPDMSARSMYFKLKPQGIGRDRFEGLAFQHGFRLNPVRNYRKTTRSTGSRFANLVAGLELTGINQVWVSDITYYELGDEFYYLTLVMDLYSRRILGWHASDSLRSEDTSLPALKKALHLRGPGHYDRRLIFHSDGGGQYYCVPILELTKRNGILNSMGETVYENAHAERVIGTIKNSYVIPYGPADLPGLKRALSRAITLYNEDRPHSALGRKTPAEFESFIAGLEPERRPPLNVYKEALSTVIHRYQQKEKRSKKEKGLLLQQNL